jgi:hypothetical protein
MVQNNQSSNNPAIAALLTDVLHDFERATDCYELLHLMLDMLSDYDVCTPKRLQVLSQWTEVMWESSADSVNAKLRRLRELCNLASEASNTVEASQPTPPRYPVSRRQE